MSTNPQSTMPACPVHCACSSLSLFCRKFERKRQRSSRKEVRLTGCASDAPFMWLLPRLMGLFLGGTFSDHDVIIIFRKDQPQSEGSGHAHHGIKSPPGQGPGAAQLQRAVGEAEGSARRWIGYVKNDLQSLQSTTRSTFCGMCQSGTSRPRSRAQTD